MKPYKTPTEDAAIARETAREKLRKKHGVREGDMVLMKLKVRHDAFSDSTKEAMLRVKVVDIHRYFIVIRRPAGYNESFDWDEFERRRRD